MIFCKNLVKLFARLITISCTSLLSHLNSTIWHKSSLQRFVCLKTNDLLKIFCLFANVSRSICCKSGYYFCLHIKNAAFCTLLFLKFLKFTPQNICCFCWSFQERFVSFIRCVVLLNKAANIYRIYPFFSFKTSPLLKMCHFFVPLSYLSFSYAPSV